MAGPRLLNPHFDGDETPRHPDVPNEHYEPDEDERLVPPPYDVPAVLMGTLLFFELITHPDPRELNRTGTLRYTLATEGTPAAWRQLKERIGRG